MIGRRLGGAWPQRLSTTKRLSGLFSARVVSTAASFLLIASFARVLPLPEFAASQLVFVLIGLVGVVADPGLGLATTRAVASNELSKVADLLWLRCLVTGVCLLAIGALSIGVSDSPGHLVGALLPGAVFVWVLLVRNHIFVQTRAGIGVQYEIQAGCIANILESLAAAAAVSLFHSVTVALWTYGVVGGLSTTVLWYDAKHRRGQEPHLSVAITPSWDFGSMRGLFAKGLAPSILGVAGKALTAVLIHATSGGGSAPSARWHIVTARIVDSLFPLLVAILAYPRYVASAAARERVGTANREVLAPALAALIVAASIGPALLSAAVPNAEMLMFSFTLAIAFGLFVAMCDASYQLHAIEGSIRWAPVGLIAGAVALVPVVASTSSVVVAVAVSTALTAVAYILTSTRDRRLVEGGHVRTYGNS